jgi:hypothetical protein
MAMSRKLVRSEHGSSVIHREVAIESSDQRRDPALNESRRAMGTPFAAAIMLRAPAHLAFRMRRKDSTAANVLTRFAVRAGCIWTRTIPCSNSSSFLCLSGSCSWSVPASVAFGVSSLGSEPVRAHRPRTSASAISGLAEEQRVGDASASVRLANRADIQ